MHHFLSKPDWLADVNETLAKSNNPMRLDFDMHFVLVEEDWRLGREPEDVAEAIAEDRHQRLSFFKSQQAQASHG